MTLKQALLIVRPPLKFGDARQIQAVRFLEKVEVAMGDIGSCEQCRGNGYQAYSYEEAEVCGFCVWDLPPDVKEAVIETLHLYERFPRIITGDEDSDEHARLIEND